MTPFTSLTNRYDSWESLKSFLTSEEGGKFTIRDCVSTNFAIIRYTRGVTDFSKFDGSQWFRSVVWDMVQNRPICVSPPKATEGLPPINTTLTVEVFVEGVMINVFGTLDKNNEPKYHLASRSQYDAGGTFYSKRTFKELFTDALAEKELFDYVEKPTAEFPSTFQSLVLQHPEHQIVTKFTKPHLIPVEDGKVDTSGNVFFTQTQKVFVDRLTFTTEKEIWDLIQTKSLEKGWRWQGLVFKDDKGNRWRLKNTTFTYLQGLRGNDALAADRFLRLRAAHKITEYLTHFSEEKELFWSLEQKLRSATKGVYDAYASVHKSHEKVLADIPQPAKTIVFKLHAHYLATLRPQKRSIVMKDVVDLVNALPLWEQRMLLPSKL